MHRGKLFASLACAVGIANAAIQPNWDKLTDFTAKFTEHWDQSELDEIEKEQSEFQNPPVLPLRQSRGHGEFNVDVFGERLYAKGGGSFTTLEGGEGDMTNEMFFDGPQGRVGFKMQGKYPSPMGDITLEPSCVKIRFPQGMLPPGDMIKQQFEQTEPMVAQSLNMVPHFSTTVDGESVQVFTGAAAAAPMYFAMHDDATPVGIGFHKPEGGSWQPNLKITEWNQGAQIPDDMNCAELSAEEFLAIPYARQSLRSLDRLMVAARSMKPLQHVLQHIPAQPSLLVESARGADRKPQTSATAMMPTMVLAFAAGTLASLLVLFVLRPHRAAIKASRPLLA